LASGAELDRIAGVTSFRVGGEGAGFVIYRRGNAAEASKEPTPPGKKGTDPTPPKTTNAKAAGTDLYIRDLSGTVERVIPDVTEYSLSNDETALVYVVASKTEAKNGIYLLNPRFGTAPTALKAGPGRYTSLTWDEQQTRLAFCYDDSQIPPDNLAPAPRPVGAKPAPVETGTPTATVPPRWRVFVWERSAKAGPAAARAPLGTAAGFAALVGPAVVSAPPQPAPLSEVLGPDTPGLKKGWGLSTTGLSFSRDGTKLYVSAAPERPAPVAGPPAGDDIRLDIWHWKDGPIQPMQKLTAGADRNKSYGGVLLLDTKQYRQLSTDAVGVQPPERGDWAVAADNSKYRHTIGYAFPVPSDYALVNVRTGEAKGLLTASPFDLTLSPDGTYARGFDGADWFSISVPGGKKVNLTAKLGVKFCDEDHDQPSEPQPYRTAAWAPDNLPVEHSSAEWTADGKFVLVGDRFDIWKLALDGSSAENLTKIGRAQGLRFTVLKLRDAEKATPDRTVDLGKPVLLGAENLTTRDTGFYRLEPDAPPKLLLMGARAYGVPLKAKNADAYALTVQTFSQYPDYYATTPEFHELKRVTDVNPAVKDYNWGKAELIKYTSGDGVPLRGVLVKPENFDPAKKYPMVVYFYERLSDKFHEFRVPNVTRGQVINPTFYASNGYLVLMPDIAYKVGAPGPSALKCVLPAVQAVVDKGYVDEKAIGINGQSWGGYQTAYLITQTTRFRAAVAGAPVSNMFSAYGGIRWESGLPRQFQYEHSQSRIGATPWDAPLKYLENSPLFMADRVQTPLLMIHNDQDGAVPWYQGIEFFLALRRLGKEAYLLNYNGQPHNLTNRTAARDFSVRMFQFFEHHLKGKPAPAWMEKGVPYIDREKENEQWKKLSGAGK
jgi:dipeptidyl aminopeptidase/acylaminoacyl peptidase